MALYVTTFILGPLENNTYLLADPDTKKAVLIDPSFDSQQVLDTVERLKLELAEIWLTHAHFDHIAGASIAWRFNPPLKIALHEDDLPLWKHSGGASDWGISLDPSPEPEILFFHGQQMKLGNLAIEVRHVPGHTPGHVMFYIPDEKLAFVGDVIFYRGIGRTDFPGGDFKQLIHSIQTQIFTLPPETILLSGHGPETTVAEEMANNPFLR